MYCCDSNKSVMGTGMAIIKTIFIRATKGLGFSECDQAVINV